MGDSFTTAEIKISRGHNIKNVQVIDGAMNCNYDIFAIHESDFKIIFPGEGHNIEFIEDVEQKIGENALEEIHPRIWEKRVRKAEVVGSDHLISQDIKSESC